MGLKNKFGRWFGKDTSAKENIQETVDNTQEVFGTSIDEEVLSDTVSESKDHLCNRNSVQRGIFQNL